MSFEKSNRESDKVGAFMRKANLWVAFLRKANLRGDDLWRADLSETVSAYSQICSTKYKRTCRSAELQTSGSGHLPSD